MRIFLIVGLWTAGVIWVMAFLGYRSHRKRKDVKELEKIYSRR